MPSGQQSDRSNWKMSDFVVLCAILVPGCLCGFEDLFHLCVFVCVCVVFLALSLRLWYRQGGLSFNRQRLPPLAHSLSLSDNVYWFVVKTQFDGLGGGRGGGCSGEVCLLQLGWNRNVLGLGCLFFLLPIWAQLYDKVYKCKKTSHRCRFNWKNYNQKMFIEREDRTAVDDFCCRNSSFIFKQEKCVRLFKCEDSFYLWSLRAVGPISAWTSEVKEWGVSGGRSTVSFQVKHVYSGSCVFASVSALVGPSTDESKEVWYCWREK